METGVNSDIFIAASAGTGKTYRLVKHYVSIFERAFKLNEKLDVHNVVAITFTRKAAKEMKERVMKNLDENIERGIPGNWLSLRARMVNAWISTIHSFCERILRESATYLGMDPGFQVLTGIKRVTLENNVAKSYFLEHIEELEPVIELIGIDDTFKLLKNMLGNHRNKLKVSRAMQRALEPHEIGEKGIKALKATEILEKHFNGITRLYDQECLSSNYLDFDDLLTKTRELLMNHPQVQQKYIRRFKYILVDEFQDTDELQKEIIDLLHVEGSNFLFFVGDAKQSIYRFRGADVTVFNRTKEHFELNGKPVEELDTNRRSHPDIVEFQNRLFSKIMINDFSGKYYKAYYEKEIKALPYDSSESESRVRVLLSDQADDSKEVANYISRLLQEELTFRDKSGKTEKRRIQPGDIAILLRSFTKITKYEEALENLGIPYYTVGSREFYNRPEVAGPLAWLDMVVDPLDDNAFTRFLLSPAFGGTLDEILSLKSAGKTFYEGLVNTRDEKFANLAELFKKHSTLKHLLSPSELLEDFIISTNYLPKLATLKGAERMISNVNKMLDIAKELDNLGTSLRELSATLKAFVDSSDETEASLETEESNSVKLLTVHKSKGLEFPIVVVADTFWREKTSNNHFPGIFFDKSEYFLIEEKPSDRSKTLQSKLYIDEMEKIYEEEKRTLYVAFSRPRDLLIVSLNGKASAIRPWSQMLLGTLFTQENDEKELLDEFEGIVEIETSGKGFLYTHRNSDEQEEGELPEIRIIQGFSQKAQIEYVSPSLLTQEFEISLEPRSGELNLERNPAELGTLAHAYFEAVGLEGQLGRITLNGLLKGGKLGYVDRTRFTPEEDQEVRNILSKLTEHPLVKEIESAHKVYSELKIQKKLKNYILLGILDKIYLTEKGWKIVDFKFAYPDSRLKEKYEFQLKFYMYIARELFDITEAKLFYLKDGSVSEPIILEEGFEKELVKKIESFGGDSDGN
ncbi:exodeoxyribonuclease V [Kosmotoga arenicorallina S304]|uniref:DNA 3'-5' helicase n=1 Tax=Kosmotoga arenicorallina S304 TaxID=1453497 RepID=A0A176K140_9BACT|nr:UvrD-helicase domain-containing protein [Kosmotoga arenicorallina]OAA30406.1 exodeoxyribonuclease V [Kosmotoga arenicorallina S304]